ncbi:hypothetical protein ACVRZD_08480 [Streptococcus hongkongensis]|nr:hypothetical protein NC01_05555 [Streptococcus uberis]
MDKKLIPIESGHLLTLSYDVNGHIDDFWNLLATTSGLQKWFPELSRQENCLHFTAGDFTDSLAILNEETNKAFAFEWFGATIHFSISKNESTNNHHIVFTEEIPSTVNNLSTDLAGWYNQNQRLRIYANTGHLPEVKALQQDSKDWIDSQLRKKR